MRMFIGLGTGHSHYMPLLIGLLPTYIPTDELFTTSTSRPSHPPDPTSTLPPRLSGHMTESVTTLRSLTM